MKNQSQLVDSFKTAFKRVESSGGKTVFVHIQLTGSFTN
jgi:hypothetical protein